MDLNPADLQTALEWAGAKLIAMSGRRAGPAGYKSNWPDFSLETFQVLDFRQAGPLRIEPPPPADIDLSEEILLIPNLCSDVLRRRVLHARALTHPISGRYLYTWKRIAKLLKKDYRSVKELHARALAEAAFKAPSATVCRIFTIPPLAP